MAKKDAASTPVCRGMAEKDAASTPVCRLSERRTSEDRLQVAVRLMQRSNEDLRRNVDEFRLSLNYLDNSMQSLERTTLQYQANLGQINVRTLRARALQLGKIADRWLRTS